MEQTNMVMAMYQAMAAQGMVPKTGKGGDKAADSFQKLLDQQAQPARDDAPVDGKGKPELADNQKEDAPVQAEDPLEQVKKLAEQGYAMTQPNAGTVPIDFNNVALGQTETGEYVVMQLGDEGEVLSIIELDPWQQQQLQQLMHNMELMEQAKDPEADAMLEATDPNADHSPVELLEKAVDDQAGQVMEQSVDGAQAQKRDDEQVEVLDVEQGPQPLFHDVKAAPVKVGEVYDAQQTDEADVAAQIDAQMAQAMQAGESTVRIQLTPANLGQVVVEITQSAEGVLKVALTASSMDTRGILERHANDLQSMLASRSQQSVEVNVQRSQEDQQSQNQQHSYDGHNGHAQQEQERRQRREHTSPEDFMQQLRLGLIPDDGI